MPEKQDENQTQETEDADRAKIGMVEGIVVVTIAGIADIAEILGTLVLPTPIIGQVSWFLAASYGIFTSAMLFIWAALRGMGTTTRAGELLAKRTAAVVLGSVLDTVAGTILPIRTASVLIAIALNNSPKLKKVTRAAGYVK